MKLIICAITLIAFGDSAVISAMEKEETAEKSDLNKALFGAAAVGDIIEAEELLRAGADVNATDDKGDTPLDKAILYSPPYRLGHLPMVEFLWKKGANINARNKKGATPLHLAVIMDHVAIAIFLVNHEANMYAKDSDGDTPISLAARLGSPEMVKFLMNRDVPTFDIEEAQILWARKAFMADLEAIAPDLYKKISTAVARKPIMDIIKDLAPTLYEAIVAVDRTGAHHIEKTDRYGTDNMITAVSKRDGLPVIHFGSEKMQQPLKYIKATIAHELGHYALGHLYNPPTIKLKMLEKAPEEERVLKIRGKPFKVGGELPVEESFKHAFSRQQEFEADRFAIIEFGIPIDDAIATRTEKIPPTFKSTHPSATARIKQFEDLRREVELYKAQKRQPKPIDWKALAAQYLKESQS